MPSMYTAKLVRAQLPENASNFAGGPHVKRVKTGNINSIYAWFLM